MMTKLRHAASLLAAASAFAAFASPASAQQVDRVVAFGDSYADSGNAFALIGSNPYYPIYPENRFSSGANYVDILADTLNVPLDNFAIGGATTGYNNVALGVGPGFSYEVDQFLGVGTDNPVFPTTSSFNATDLVTVSIGGNDGRAYQQGGGTVAGAATAAATSVAQATYNLDRLVAAGAPTISFLAGDTSQLPEVGFYPDPAAAASVRAAFSGAYAAGIQSTLSGYAADGVMVHYLDLNLVLNDVVANPGAYGITKGLACPSFPPPAGPVLDPAYATCITDATGYMFYGDQLHLTEDGYRVIARYVEAQLEAPLTLGGPSSIGLDNARQFGRSMTNRLDSGAPRDGDMPEGLSLNISADGNHTKNAVNYSSDAFRSNGLGVMASLDYGFGSGMMGAAIRGSHQKAHYYGERGQARDKSLEVGVYGGVGIAGAFVQGYAGFGRDRYDTDRMGVVLPVGASPKGHHALAGLKGGYLIPMAGLRVGPVAAIDYAHAYVKSYAEEGDPALNLGVGSVRAKSLRGSLGVELRGDVDLGAGTTFRPFASAVLEKQFNNNDRMIAFNQQAAPTIVNAWDVYGESKHAYGRLTGGIAAGIMSNVRIDAQVSGTLGRDGGQETSGNVAARIAF